MNSIPFTRVLVGLLGLMYLSIGASGVLSGLPEVQPVVNNHFQFYVGVFAATAIPLILYAMKPGRFLEPAITALGITVVAGLCRLMAVGTPTLWLPEVYMAIVIEVGIGGWLLARLWRQSSAMQAR